MSNKDFQKNRSSSQGQSKQKGSFIMDNDDISVGTPWRLMVFSFVLFVFSIFIFFGLKFGYDMYLDSQLSALEEKSEQLSNRVTEEEQAHFLAFYSQLNNLERILQERGFSHNVFKFLENNTIQSVYYTNANYSSSRNSVSLSGVAEGMKELVEQVSVFSDSDKVEEAVMNDVSIQGTNQVGFEINVRFNPNFLKKPFN
ncbi:MAG TPA: hypothetical protein VKO61_00645 [Candidatus Paceibacterota bacterium]|nr:hypothetical protein [Candidatus Paceibacterota bacterium]